jgi:hypothetical protein
LSEIFELLETNGTKSVFVGDLRPFLFYLTPKNIIGVYLSLFGEQTQMRLMDYVNNEFLGGTTGVCKVHALSFFADISKREEWALKSNNI